MSDKPTFYVKSDNCDFASRQKNIFDQLNQIESENKHVQPTEIDIDLGPERDVVSRTVGVVRKKRSETKHLRGKESIFKRPETLPPRFKARNIPDYRRYPNKWVKYTLADVSSDDMSERSNTATAMAFLKEMEERKSTSEVENDTSCMKIKFKPKAVNANKTFDDTNEHGSEKGLFKSSKLVMPEYVVGREKKTTKRKEKREVTSLEEKRRKEIKLDHLAENEDGDEY